MNIVVVFSEFSYNGLAHIHMYAYVCTYCKQPSSTKFVNTEEIKVKGLRAVYVHNSI